MYHEAEIDPRLLKWFEAGVVLPARDPEKSAKTRQGYLSQVEALVARTQIAPIPASQARGKTPAWLAWLQPLSGLRLAQVVLAAFMLVLALGGFGIVQAQSAAPGQALYPLKLWSEQAWLKVNPDTTTAWQWSLVFAERRFDESLGYDQPELVSEYNHLVDRSILAARSLPPAGRQVALAAIQLQLAGDMLRIQEKVMATNMAQWVQFQAELQLRINWLDETTSGNPGGDPGGGHGGSMPVKPTSSSTQVQGTTQPRRQTPTPPKPTQTPKAIDTTPTKHGTATNKSPQAGSTSTPQAATPRLGTSAPTGDPGGKGTPQRTAAPKNTERTQGGTNQPLGGTNQPLGGTNQPGGGGPANGTSPAGGSGGGK